MLRGKVGKGNGAMGFKPITGLIEFSLACNLEPKDVPIIFENSLRAPGIHFEYVRNPTVSGRCPAAVLVGGDSLCLCWPSWPASPARR